MIAKIHAPVELKVIKGASHFFDAHLEELKRVITAWVYHSLRSARSEITQTDKR